MGTCQNSLHGAIIDFPCPEPEKWPLYGSLWCTQRTSLLTIKGENDLSSNAACCCLLCSSVQLKVIVWQASQLGHCLMTFTDTVGGHSCPPTLYNPPMRPHHVQLSRLIVHR